MISFLAWVNIMAVCPDPRVMNVSEEPWNERDTKEMNTALERGTCGRLYPIDLPCMETFIKIKPLHYKVYCGPKRGER